MRCFQQCNKQKNKDLYDWVTINKVGIFLILIVLVSLAYLDLHHENNKTLIMNARTNLDSGKKTKVISEGDTPFHKISNLRHTKLKEIDGKKISKINNEKIKFNNVSAITNLNSIIHKLFDLATKDPIALNNIILNEDPLKVNNPTTFLCPTNTNKYDYPGISNKSNSINFKNNVKGSFIFYQHLRKAGGTGFCDLSMSNLPRKQVNPIIPSN